MSTLPANFPVSNLSAVNRSKVESFYRLFAERYYNEYQLGHFLLAAYAAVPSLLTPDLLYRIWQNFHGYRWSGAAATIHRVAVSDVLLSSLCRETGFELFEMEPEIKLAFLEWLKKIETDQGSLWAQRGIHTIDRIAAFVGYYHRSPNGGLARWGKVYTDLQEMEALSYADPNRLAGMLLEQIRSQAAAGEENALLRTLDTFLKTQQRLDRLLPEGQKIKAFDEPRQEIAAIKDLLQKNEEGFLEKLQAHPAVKGQLSEVNGGGIELKVKQQVAGKIESLVKPKLRVLAIGAEIAADEQQPNYRGNVYDAHRVVSCLQSLLLEDSPPEITMLYEEEATRSRILSALEELSRHSGPADEVLIYISCSAYALQEGGCGIFCIDAVNAVGANKREFTMTNLTDKEFNEAARRIKCNSLTAIIEAPYSGAGQWLDVDEGNNRLFITACGKDEDAGQVANDEARYSLFTEWLVQAWDRAEYYLNWRELIVNLLYWQSQAVETQDTSQPVMQHPVIRGNLVSLNNVLGTAGRVSWQLETLLRRTGFYTSGYRPSYKEELKRFCLTIGLQTDLPEAQYIRPLEEYRETQLAAMIPVYLLVFSDPDNRLQELKEEKAALERILSPMDQSYKIKLLVVQDPTPDELADIFTDPLYRNRIQVFYYSGNDDRGDFILQDGTFGIDHLGRLLNCQENLDLLIANTCRSDQLASYASQLGVRMAIGFEGVITDSMGADFGRQLFEWIRDEKDLLAFEAACQSSTLTFRQLADDVKPFRFFYPQWVKEPFVLTERRKGQVQPEKKQERKKTIYGLVVGISELTWANNISRHFRYPKENARRFLHQLEEYAGLVDRDLVVDRSVAVTRRQAASFLDLLTTSQPGDTCVFFYSGMAILGQKNEVQDLVFLEDNNETILSEASLSWGRQLMRTAYQRGIHLLMILDIQGVVRSNRSIYQLLFAANEFVHCLVLQNMSDPAAIQSRGYEENNYFFESLSDILAGGGYRFNYPELFSRLKIRMSRYTEQVPSLISMGYDNWNLSFLTGEAATGIAYRLAWEADKGWFINAGQVHGIRPSLSFMHTLFRTEEGRQVTVSQVLADHSIVEDFDGDRNTLYPVSLAQNALPKVKIAFAPWIDKVMRERLEEYIKEYDIYYTEMVPTVTDAYYFIGNKEGEYLLVQRADLRNGEDALVPVFDYQSHPYEFIKQIEYIAQWQGVLEFNNHDTRLEQKDIQFSFEKVEGANRDNIENLAGEVVPDDESMVLNYKKEEGKWRQPAMRCKAVVVERPLYLSILYLDARYGITSLGNILVEPSSAGNYIPFKIDYRDREYRTLPIVLEKEYEEKGLTRITEYLKIFVSEKPVDFDRLKQEALVFDAVISRSRGADSHVRTDSVDTSNSDWMSYTIPIRIIKEESNEQEELPQMEQTATKEVEKDQNKPAEPLSGGDMLRILFFCPFSRSGVHLNMQKEAEMIRDVLRMGANRDRISFIFQVVEKPDDILASILQQKPTIVHFTGAYNLGLYLETESGKSFLINFQEMQRIFDHARDFTQCIILNGAYSDEQVAMFGNFIPYVIGIPGHVSDKASIAFSITFYESISRGQSVELAFDFALAAKSYEFGAQSSMPELFKRNPKE